jgi:hypothetical protein
LCSRRRAGNEPLAAADTNQWSYEPMRKLLATIAFTLGVMAVLPTAAAAATAIEYGLI